MTERILGFDDFMRESRKATKAVLQREVKSAVSEFAWEGLISTGYLTEKESIWLVENAKDFNKLDESLLGQLRDKIKSVKDTQIGKDVYAKVSKVYDRASTFTKYLISQFNKFFDKALGYFVKKFEPAKKALLADIKNGKVSIGTVKNNISSDIKLLSETISFWLKSFQAMYTKAMEHAFSKELLKEALHTDARLFDALLESEGDIESSGSGSEDSAQGIIFSVINKITHKLEKIPPFNMLAKVKEIAEIGTSKMLKSFSELTNKMGGPGVYEFAAISAIAGFFIEYYVKHLAVSSVDSILGSEAVLRFLPMASELVHVLTIIALLIATVETAKELANSELQTK